jgi:hypothetical protein
MTQEIKTAKALGHDGIFFPKITTPGETNTIAVFKPTQIKSAIGNRGTFDPKNPHFGMGARRSYLLEPSQQLDAVLRGRRDSTPPDDSGWRRTRAEREAQGDGDGTPDPGDGQFHTDHEEAKRVAAILATLLAMAARNEAMSAAERLALGIDASTVEEIAVRVGRERAAELMGLTVAADGSFVVDPTAEKAITVTTEKQVNQVVDDALAAQARPVAVPDGATADEVDTSPSWASLFARLMGLYAFASYRPDVVADTETDEMGTTVQLLAWQDAGVEEVDVSDGELWDEPCIEANGQRWTIEQALDNPKEHPYCQRTFTPVTPLDDALGGVGDFLNQPVGAKLALVPEALGEWDPDLHPRDEGGEFTESGGGGGAGGVLPADSWPTATAHPDYLYHATNRENLADIQDEGKLKLFGPSHGTPDQNAWPDRGVERRAYFAQSPHAAQSFAPAEGKSALLRVRRDSHEFRAEGTGDFYTRKAVPTSRLEYLSVGGTWHPVAGSGSKLAAERQRLYDESESRDELGRWSAGGVVARADERYPKAGGVVDGREVLEYTPNLESIGASFSAGEHTVLPGVREVPVAAFESLKPHDMFYAASDHERVDRLAEAIKASGQIAPLIVAHDEKGPYILEGAHRAAALQKIGAKSFPAVVVVEHPATTQKLYAEDQPRDEGGRWTGGGVSSAIEGIKTATAADVAAGKVPNVSMGDPTKVGPMVLAQYQGEGQVHVFPDFFDQSEFGRAVTLAHEFGHEVAQRSASTQGWVEPLRPFRTNPDNPWNYDNFAGMSSRPEEMLADIYAELYHSKTQPWEEEGGRYAKAFGHVLDVASKAGLPLPRWYKGGAQKLEAEWDESLHPRDDAGKFADAAGGGPTSAGTRSLAISRVSPGYEPDRNEFKADVRARLEAAGLPPARAKFALEEVDRYTAYGAFRMNELLRGADSVPQGAEGVLRDKTAAILDFMDHTAAEPGTTYRGVVMPAADLARQLASGELRSPAFMSTTRDEQFTDRWLVQLREQQKNNPDTPVKGDTEVVYEIAGRNGVPFVETQAGWGQKEITYRPGTSFKIRSSRQDSSGRWHVQIEEKP